MRTSSSPSFSTSTRLGLGLLVVLVVATGASAFDLTGRWRLEGGGFGPFADIVQTGDVVSVSLQGNPSLTSYVFDGTATGEVLSAAAPNTICPGNPPFGLGLKIYGDEATLDGKMLQSCGGYPSITRALLTRCECDDGNLNDGDGCDSHCRVEPCFVCTGAPSTCLPQSDGETCNDRNDCSTGETCTAGNCGNGASVAGCVDMTGRWLRFVSSDPPAVFSPSIGSWVLRQENGIVDFRSTTVEGPGAIGSIASTGALHVETPSTALFCSDPSMIDGNVAPGGITYSGSGELLVQTPRTCIGLGTYQEHGYRCGGGVVDTGENCLVPSCVQCSGDPAECTPLPDGTPCEYSDPCTYVAACNAGVCEPAEVVACPNCSQCGSSGGCEPGPREDCLRTADPDASRLQLSNLASDDKNLLRFTWKKGAAFTASQLADPVATDPVSLCVFDESAASSSLLYQADIPNSATCLNGESCWSDLGDRGFTFRDSRGAMAGLNIVSLRPGADGKTSVQVKGKGATLVSSPLPSPTGFPTPALPLPLRTQLQVNGGACFEATFGAAGIKKNADGLFSAVGTP